MNLAFYSFLSSFFHPIFSLFLSTLSSFSFHSDLLVSFNFYYYLFSFFSFDFSDLFYFHSPSFALTHSLYFSLFTLFFFNLCFFLLLFYFSHISITFRSLFLPNAFIFLFHLLFIWSLLVFFSLFMCVCVCVCCFFFCGHGNEESYTYSLVPTTPKDPLSNLLYFKLTINTRIHMHKNNKKLLPPRPLPTLCRLKGPCRHRVTLLQILLFDLNHSQRKLVCVRRRCCLPPPVPTHFNACHAANPAA